MNRGREDGELSVLVAGGVVLNQPGVGQPPEGILVDRIGNGERGLDGEEQEQGHISLR